MCLEMTECWNVFGLKGEGLARWCVAEISKMADITAATTMPFKQRQLWVAHCAPEMRVGTEQFKTHYNSPRLIFEEHGRIVIEIFHSALVFFSHLKLDDLCFLLNEWTEGQKSWTFYINPRWVQRSLWPSVTQVHV